AAGGLAAAAQAGISVPDQLSIAGFDDSSLANVVWPPLTTVRQPVSEMAALAVRHLVSAREDEQVAPYDTLAHVIVTRGSTSRSSDAD
ncbi:MAG: substrate-binding domain-containing protein, partial [Pseudomonadota bacterium]